jgi:hypothetical protein
VKTEEMTDMVVGDIRFGVVSYVIVGGGLGVFFPRKVFLFFYP